MEELPALAAGVGEVFMFLANAALFLGVAVASYRRSRCLSRYPVWRSLLIAVAAGAYWPIWLLVSVINRKQLDREWRMYEQEREIAPMARARRP
jgi:hypothetical protein